MSIVRPDVQIMRSPPPVQLPLSSVLQDLVSNVQIQSPFLLHHPHYLPSEFPPEIVVRLQQLPEDLQHQYLSWRLRNFLHNIYFSGDQIVNTPADDSAASLPPPLDLKNNTKRGLNLEFYEQLHNGNRGEGYFDVGWCVLRQEHNGSLAMRKQNLTLHIEPHRHLRPSEQFATVGDRVAIHLPRNCLEVGFYIAVGNAGLPPENSSMVEIYFNFNAVGAIAFMGSLTPQLNAMQIPFSFKVADDPSEYGRYNSGTLRVESIHYESVRQVLQTLYQEECLQFRSTVPLFTKFLAPGLGLAESPEGELAAAKDFGLHRCQLIANALLAAWDNGDNSPESRMDAIHQQFSQCGIAWQHPYLNPNSEDIYTLLN